MKKQLTEHAAAAKMIRTELKKHGIKATVRAKAYAGGESITVTVNNELPATYKAIKAYCSRFQYGHFDGMQDLYEYSNHSDDLPQGSNPGDLVLSPFTGIGSEGVVSIQEGRSFVGFELKPSYYKVAMSNLSSVAQQGGLF